MKRETLKTLITMLLCVIGAFLIGFNANNLSTPLGIALFIVGVAILTLSPLVVKRIFAERQEQ